MAEVDYYELLGVAESATDEEINRAWRRTALKYHPDKNPGDKAKIEKFYQLQEALLILTTASTRTAFDNARKARLARQRRDEAFDLKRRRMKDDLVAREDRATKRQAVDEEAKFQSALQALQQEGARMRMEHEKRRREQELQEARVRDAHAAETRRFPEEQRTVKVRWKGGVEATELHALSKRLLEPYGELENLVVTPKATMVVFKSVLAADSAVNDAALAQNKAVKSVSWAFDKPKIEARPSPPAATPQPQFPTARQPPPYSPAAAGSQPKDTRDYESATLLRMREAARLRQQQKS